MNRFDPRTRVIFYACFTTAVLILIDVRTLVAMAVLGIALLIFTRVPWAKLRPVLVGAVVFIAFITALNLFFRSPLEATQQALRAVAMATASLAILLTFDPAQLGVTFKRLGFPDKFAFLLDLTLRFVPTLSRDFRITVDAQKARGYELETKDRSLKSLITVGTRFVPLIVPVVVRAVLDAEDRANAMEMRAFGTGPRTWIQELRFKPMDYAVIVLSLGLVAAAIAFRVVVQ